MAVRVRLMDEYGSQWPLWLDDLGQDTEAVFTISGELADRLRAWAREFDTEFEFGDGWKSPEIASRHEQEGRKLATDVQGEIGNRFRVEVVLIR